jgi:peptidoglycan hydrolase-like protein with peptidoglycan-binding domain
MTVPNVATVVKSGSGGFDLAPCVVPAYISALPYDPSAAGAHYVSETDYDTGYQVFQDANGRVTVSATGEITPSISVIR